jgi:crotonobetainyl-CoA:carnitine CoA-transferase CaiB-like acyl-CoA transferase
MLLADLGAEVIKIENPHDGGDVSRHTGPFFSARTGAAGQPVLPDLQPQQEEPHAGPQEPDQGRHVLRRLAATCDAVMNNLRGDQPDKLGLTYAALGRRASLVCVHLSAYGRDNERAGWPGYDYLMQAEAGFLHLTGEPDGPPARMGLSMVDYMTGITTAMALLAGVLGARAAGAAATSTSACSTWRWRSSPTRPPGTSTAATWCSACRARRTRRPCPASWCAAPTAGCS